LFATHREMDKLPRELLTHILTYVGFGETRGFNILTTRRVSKAFHNVITHSLVFEVDRNEYESPVNFIRQSTFYYLSWVQKRNASVDWDDHRGYLIIQDFDMEKWLYYEKLLKQYFFDHRPVVFPHYRGKFYFYEFLS